MSARRVTSLMLALVGAGLAPAVVSAQNEAPMHVSATVAPKCRFSLEPSYAAAHPAVIASCAASGLRVLHVNASSGASIRAIAGRQLRAGGDAVFVISRDGASDGSAVLVTLDF